MTLYTAFLCVFLYAFAVADDDVVLKPAEGAKGKSAAILFAPGAGIGPGAYVPMIQKIQAAMAPEYALWAGIPALPLNVTTLGLKGAFKRVASQLTGEGLPSEHDTWYAGHSLGGAIVPGLVNDPKELPPGFDKPAGLVLMGAFLTRSFKTEAVAEKGPGQYVFPTCPVLTIGGELDGLCRVSRIAEARYTQIDQSMSMSIAAAKHYFPVTVIEGMTHMQFASGEIPSLVRDRDLIPEISYEDAHARVAADFSAFAKATTMAESYTKLESRLEESLMVMQPQIDTLLMEGFHQFNPPCYCETKDEYGGLEYGTCAQQPGCTASCPWTQQGQQIMFSGTKGLQSNAVDSQHVVTEEHPSCHLPFIHSGMDRNTGTKKANPGSSNNPGNGKDESPPLCTDSASCSLEGTTVTQVIYESGSEYDIWRITLGLDSVDTGFYPISASELKSKMKSRQAGWEAAAVSGAQDKGAFDAMDSPDAGRCAEINQAAIDTALSMVPAKTRSRYEKYGQKYLVSTDDSKVCAAGPCWIWAGLEYSDKGEAGVTIKAPSFAEENTNPFPCGEKNTDDSGPLPCPAGMHYCKLVSPARVAEWMYTDSLRLNYSLKSQAKNK